MEQHAKQYADEAENIIILSELIEFQKAVSRDFVF